MSVVVGGIGGLSGFFAASFVTSLLEPTFTWRALFLTNLPTALLMVLLIKWVPESPRFLIHRGFHDEARKVMASVGVPVGVMKALHLPSAPRGKQSAVELAWRAGRPLSHPLCSRPALARATLFTARRAAVPSSAPLGDEEGLRRRDGEVSASGSSRLLGRGLRGFWHRSG